jgi:hypothetical protein
MWSVAWALGDAGERPPPSSLVARCDTAEALACRPRNASEMRGSQLLLLRRFGLPARHAEEARVGRRREGQEGCTQSAGERALEAVEPRS